MNRGASLRTVDRLWPGLLAGGFALWLYARTLAPGLTWAHSGADGGDLLAAALTGGVPHPPGYPLYQLLLRGILAVRPAGASPALAGNWFSALAAALAVALLAVLIRRSLSPDLLRGAFAAVAAMAWAASPALWSQAVITEVYALNALAVVALVWLLWGWREALAAGHEGTGTACLVSAGLGFGLGLGNHLSLALLLPGALAWLYGARAYLSQTPRWALPAALVAILAGLCVYLYLPLAAAGDPPVNWGAPRTLQQMAWLVSAQPYRGLVFGLAWHWLPGRLEAFAGEALRQYWPWGAALALYGLWRLDRSDRGLWRFTGLVALAFSLYALGYNTADSYVYLIPAWAMVALWLAHGLQALSSRLYHALRNMQYGSRAAPWAVAFLALLVVPLASLWSNYAAMDLSHERGAQEFVSGVLNSAATNGVILVAGDQATFALWYGLYGLGERPDLVPLNVNLYTFDWYRQTLASHHPGLVAQPGTADLPALSTLLVDLAARRPLYRAGELPAGLPAFAERQTGPLVQLTPR